jgi:hypothetical protein
MSNKPGSDCIDVVPTVPVNTSVQVEAPSGAVELTVKENVPDHDPPGPTVMGVVVQCAVMVLPFEYLTVSLQPVTTNASVPLFLPLPRIPVLVLPRASEKLLGENDIDKGYVGNAGSATGFG